MQLKKTYPAIPLAVFLIVYFVPLGGRSLLIPDETRYAEIPREMIAGGDWVVPHLDGVRYFEKPVLGYWVHAGSILLFGENPFAVRLPSALAVGLSALLVYFLVSLAHRGKKDEKGPYAALAALIYLTCIEVVAVGGAAVLDSLLAFFLTGAVAAFFLATEANPGSSREKGLLVLAGISCGLAFLTKGFLAFAVPVLALAPYLVWQRRFRDLVRMAWLPVSAAILVSLPWSILIHLREPDFWRFFFWNEHVRRFLGDNAQHGKAFWYYCLLAPAMFIPWTFLVPAAVGGVREGAGGQDSRGRLLRMSLCWFAFPFLFFSISRGKLLTYILPCFPPFAILMSLGLSRLVEEGRTRTLRAGILATGILFAGGLLGLVLAPLFGYGTFYPYSRLWKWIPAVGSLAVAVGLFYLAYRSRTARNAVLLLGLAPVLLLFTVHVDLPDSVIAAKAPGALLKRHKGEIGPDTVVLSDDVTAAAVCWYLERNDVYLLGSSGELGYGLDYPDAAGRMCDAESAARFIDRNRGRLVLVIDGRHIKEWRDRLPEPVSRDDSGPEGFVLWRY